MGWVGCPEASVANQLPMLGKILKSADSIYTEKEACNYTVSVVEKCLANCVNVWLMNWHLPMSNVTRTTSFYTSSMGNTEEVQMTSVNHSLISIHYLHSHVSSDWSVSKRRNHWLVCTQDWDCGTMPHLPAHRHCTPWDCQSVCQTATDTDMHSSLHTTVSRWQTVGTSNKLHVLTYRTLTVWACHLIGCHTIYSLIK